MPRHNGVKRATEHKSWKADWDPRRYSWTWLNASGLAGFLGKKKKRAQSKWIVQRGERWFRKSIIRMPPRLHLLSPWYYLAQLNAHCTALALGNYSYKVISTESECLATFQASRMRHTKDLKPKTEFLPNNQIYLQLGALSSIWKLLRVRVYDLWTWISLEWREE